ncbi:EamA family transporter [Candidatus Uhrbacteria bacterium]|nr:EamA family transporter [Candidatus Uhrbacteria bacterium]
MLTTLILAIAVLTGALGNVLLKIGTRALPSTLDIGKILSNPMLIIGVLVMISSFPFYTLTLQRMSLGIAVPLLSSLTFLAVLVISYFVLKEPLTLTNFFGILVLIAGIWLIAQK